MQRRDFIALTALVTLMPFPGRARAAGMTYTPELLQAELADGKPVFIDFTASWCGTCRTQGRVIAALKAEFPQYEAKVSFIDVDWDTWKDEMIVAEMNIPRRSTLVVLHGDRELGRIVAQTGRAEIKALMDMALAAS